MASISQNINPDENGWYTHQMGDVNDSFATISDDTYREILNAMPFTVEDDKNKKDDFDKYDALKTREIKTQLAILGHKKHFRVYTNELEIKNVRYSFIKDYFINRIKAAGCERFVNKEWLFDLIWYKEKQDTDSDLIECKAGEGYIVKKMNLVIESEWGGKKEGDKHNDLYGEVKYDFQKLVVANAEHRVMIFQEQGGIKDWKNLNWYIKTQIDEFPMLSGDTILCIVYAKDFRSFRYQLFKKHNHKSIL